MSPAPACKVPKTALPGSYPVTATGQDAEYMNEYHQALAYASKRA